MEKEKIMKLYNYKVMTLQESIQKLKDIAHQSDVLYNKIHEKHLHAEENKKLYERWLNTRGEKLRQELNGEKKWEQYLELLPHPDKPFDINDVKDEEFRARIQEVEKLEDEDHKLFSSILDTFDSKEDKKIIKEYLSERFSRKQ
jgi:hypothetical protein